MTVYVVTWSEGGPRCAACGRPGSTRYTLEAVCGTREIAERYVADRTPEEHLSGQYNIHKTVVLAEDPPK